MLHMNIIKISVISVISGKVLALFLIEAMGANQEAALSSLALLLAGSWLRFTRGEHALDPGRFELVFLFADGAVIVFEAQRKGPDRAFVGECFAAQTGGQHAEKIGGAGGAFITVVPLGPHENARLSIVA